MIDLRLANQEPFCERRHPVYLAHHYPIRERRGDGLLESNITDRLASVRPNAAVKKYMNLSTISKNRLVIELPSILSKYITDESTSTKRSTDESVFKNRFYAYNNTYINTSNVKLSVPNKNCMEEPSGHRKRYTDNSNIMSKVYVGTDSSTCFSNKRSTNKSNFSDRHYTNESNVLSKRYTDESINSSYQYLDESRLSIDESNSYSCCRYFDFPTHCIDESNIPDTRYTLADVSANGKVGESKLRIKYCTDESSIPSKRRRKRKKRHHSRAPREALSSTQQTNDERLLPADEIERSDKYRHDHVAIRYQKRNESDYETYAKSRYDDEVYRRKKERHHRSGRRNRKPSWHVEDCRIEEAPLLHAENRAGTASEHCRQRKQFDHEEYYTLLQATEEMSRGHPPAEGRRRFNTEGSNGGVATISRDSVADSMPNDTYGRQRDVQSTPETMHFDHGDGDVRPLEHTEFPWQQSDCNNHDSLLDPNCMEHVHDLHEVGLSQSAFEEHVIDDPKLSYQDERTRIEAEIKRKYAELDLLFTKLSAKKKRKSRRRHAQSRSPARKQGFFITIRPIRRERRIARPIRNAVLIRASMKKAWKGALGSCCGNECWANWHWTSIRGVLSDY